ncbi:uncharacterized protein LOC133802135 [Humulus lupulus]|uniref:uncharacterized protein LOC133802135 n=1 Tax=Humulus lupulus TaxID=3486 RepID=UPI002B41260E|nr:uncharacterized protein LOC133802135 [Humulus lupulus]
MQAEDQRSWRIEVRAKSRNFNFKFKAAKIEPNWKIHRFSLLLKLRRFFLRVNSDSTDLKTRRRTLIPKFLRIATKSRSKSSNSRQPEPEFGLKRFQQYAKEGPFNLGALVVIVIGFVLQHIAVVVKKLIARKLWLFLVASMVPLACSVVVVDLGSYMRFSQGLYSSSKFVWNLWNCFGSFICDRL